MTNPGVIIVPLNSTSVVLSASVHGNRCPEVLARVILAARKSSRVVSRTSTAASRTNGSIVGRFGSASRAFTLYEVLHMRLVLTFHGSMLQLCFTSHNLARRLKDAWRRDMNKGQKQSSNHLRVSGLVAPDPAWHQPSVLYTYWGV